MGSMVKYFRLGIQHPPPPSRMCRLGPAEPAAAARRRPRRRPSAACGARSTACAPSVAPPPPVNPPPTSPTAPGSDRSAHSNPAPADRRFARAAPSSAAAACPALDPQARRRSAGSWRSCGGPTPTSRSAPRDRPPRPGPRVMVKRWSNRPTPTSRPVSVSPPPPPLLGPVASSTCARWDAPHRYPLPAARCRDGRSRGPRFGWRRVHLPGAASSVCPYTRRMGGAARFRFGGRLG